MIITWHGHYTIKIATKNSTIVINPHGPATGLSPFRGKIQYAVLTNPQNPQTSYLQGLQKDYITIDQPGEYALDSFTLYSRGWHNKQGQECTIQRWQMEKMTILYIGALNRKLSESELQEIEKDNIDLLITPVGGGDGLTTEQALDLVTTIEPKIVIPIHFRVKGSKEKIEPVDQFAKEVGVDPKKTEPKLSISPNKLPKEGMETIILTP